MDEENKKSRKVARREFMDTVRELAAFVKKRDRRLIKYQVGWGGWRVCLGM
jgi:DnaJ family protein A protein 5